MKKKFNVIYCFVQENRFFCKKRKNKLWKRLCYSIVIVPNVYIGLLYSLKNQG